MHTLKAALRDALKKDTKDKDSGAKTKIPRFRGTETPVELGHFCSMVDAAQQRMNLSDQQMAKEVHMVLEDEAKQWFNARSWRMQDALSKWSTLKPALEAEFCKELTPAERVRLTSGIRQKPDQTVRSFSYDCEMATRVLLAADIKARNTPQKDQEEWVASSAVNLFLAGLSEAGGLKEYVNGLAGVDTFEKAIEMAEAKEKSILEKKGTTRTTIAEIGAESQEERVPEDEIKKLKAQIEALTKGQGSGEKKKFQGNCHYCKKPGHMKRNCYSWQRVQREQGA